jgi:hypothetical protein
MTSPMTSQIFAAPELPLRGTLALNFFRWRAPLYKPYGLQTLQCSYLGEISTDFDRV